MALWVSGDGIWRMGRRWVGWKYYCACMKVYIPKNLQKTSHKDDFSEPLIDSLYSPYSFKLIILANEISRQRKMGLVAWYCSWNMEIFVRKLWHYVKEYLRKKWINFITHAKDILAMACTQYNFQLVSIAWDNPWRINNAKGCLGLMSCFVGRGSFFGR
jgi:hypothetical protein